jgi:hypothetical protein
MPRSALASLGLPQWASRRGRIDLFCQKAALTSNSPHYTNTFHAKNRLVAMHPPIAHEVLDPRTISLPRPVRFVAMYN